MSYRCRDLLRAHVAPRVAEPKASQPHGAHPSLVDVLARHPDWRKRLARLLVEPIHVERMMAESVQHPSRRPGKWKWRR